MADENPLVVAAQSAAEKAAALEEAAIKAEAEAKEASDKAAMADANTAAGAKAIAAEKKEAAEKARSAAKEATIKAEAAIEAADAVAPRLVIDEYGNSHQEDTPLDFSNQTPFRPVVKAEVGIAYNPLPQEDAARRRIAYSLIGLLSIATLAIFALLYTTTIVVADIKDFAVILGPLVTLVSAATGFYYGTKSGKL